MKFGCSVLMTAVCWRIDEVGHDVAITHEPFGRDVIKDLFSQQSDVLPSAPMTTAILEEVS